MFTLKHLKCSNMFRSYSDRLQGAYMFLVKVTDFKICKKCKSKCGDAVA